MFYWKVHYKNFDKFIVYIYRYYGNFLNEDLTHFKNYYNGCNYLYLLLDNRYDNDKIYNLAYTDYTNDSIGWLKDNCYKDMGEFYGRKEKLERLNNISKI